MSKEATYQVLLPQLRALIADECDEISVFANCAALLHRAFAWWWTGFYLVKADRLQLGQFQGPVACYRIGRGKGVCGTAWEEARTVLVPNVHDFSGHIACSDASQSEIVVPLKDENGTVIAVLDIDSEKLNHFDETDVFYLEQVAELLSKHLLYTP